MCVCDRNCQLCDSIGGLAHAGHDDDVQSNNKKDHGHSKMDLILLRNDRLKDDRLRSGKRRECFESKWRKKAI